MEHRLLLLVEAVKRYPTLDLEIDFLRSPALFNTTSTTLEQRRGIVYGFIRSARAVLRTGRRLGVRIPPHFALLDDLGIDLQRLVGAGPPGYTNQLIDYVSAGINFFSFQPANSDFAAIRAMLPDTLRVLWELSAFSASGRRFKNCTSAGHWRMSREQLATLALQAFSLGADGISAFNFEYYRDFADVSCTRWLWLCV